MMRTVTLIGATVILLIRFYVFEYDANGVSAAEAQSELPGPEYKQSDLIGDWSGFDPSGLFFYRLSLSSKNTGKCVHLFAQDKLPELFRISTWSLTNDFLKIQMEPLKGAEQRKLLIEKVDRIQMRIRFKGIERDWEHTATLYNEKYLMTKIKLARSFE